MKRIFVLTFTLLVSTGFLLYSQEGNVLKGKKIDQFPFYIYTEKGSKLNHYAPSGWMGDTGDLKINDNWGKNAQSGKSCLQVKYTAKKTKDAGWTGVYWQNPANNWGTTKGGFDLSGSKKLFFWAKGEKGGEIVEFKMGGITGDYNDSAVNATGKLELKKTWELHMIDLEDLDLSYISGGFCFVLSVDDNPDGATFYLDDIYYIDKNEPIKASADKSAQVKPKKEKSKKK